MSISAVLTGDIVNSTKLSSAVEKKLLASLQELLKPNQFEFYRGDSFQVFIKEPEPSLRVALQCRTAAIGFQKNSQMPDVRISIGIGSVQGQVKSLGSAKGDAFLLSGRNFDKIQKTETRLAITSNHDWANMSCQIIANYINSIYAKMTAKQAEVISYLLAGETQLGIAENLNKSKSTISQLAGAGRWAEIDTILTLYDDIINRLKQEM